MPKMSKQPLQKPKAYTYKDMYESTYYNNKYNLSYEQFSKILETFGGMLLESIIETGFDFKLPHRFGYLGIRKFFSKRPNIIDWQHYKHTGEKIKIKNTHSEGYSAKFVWTHGGYYSQIKYKGLYLFKPNRTYARLLAKRIKENNYIVKYFT